MSAVTTATPSNASSNNPSLTEEINTAATVAAGVAEAVPGGQAVGLGIEAAVPLADLVVHLVNLYSQKVITSSQLMAMVKVSVSGFEAAVAAWNAQSPKTNA